MPLRAGTQAAKVRKRAAQIVRARLHAEKNRSPKEIQQRKLGRIGLVVQQAAVLPQTKPALKPIKIASRPPPPSVGVYPAHGAPRSLLSSTGSRSVQQPILTTIGADGVTPVGPPKPAPEATTQAGRRASRRGFPPAKIPKHLRSARALNFGWRGYGTIDELRTLLGLPTPDQPDDPATNTPAPTGRVSASAAAAKMP